MLLSAGTFLCNASYLLIHSGITLRGAGSGRTVLKKTNGAQPGLEAAGDPQPLVIVGPGRYPSPDDTTSQNLTVDGVKGATSVTIANASGFTAGRFVLLDEDCACGWQTDRLGRGQIWASMDYLVVWQMHNPGQVFDDPNPAALSWFSRASRPRCEIKEIASVSGNTITFTTPLHSGYRASQTAQLTRYTNSPNPSIHVTNAGVEGLTVTGGGNGGIRFEAAAYSWAKDCEITVWHDEGFAVNSSFRIEIRDSYIHDAAWAQPGGAGYAISFSSGTSEVLVENCISVRANKVMVARASGAGSVFGYNHVDDGYINTIQGWIEIGLNGSHMGGAHPILFEGNYGFNFDSDHTHGNSVSHTVFRNWLPSIRASFADQLGGIIDDANQPGNGPRRCAGATGYSYYFNFAGNVLGAAGQMAGYTYDVTGPDGMAKNAIWLLGWDDVSPQPYDPACQLGLPPKRCNLGPSELKPHHS